MRNLINLDIKKEIIYKRESGKSVGDLSVVYGMGNQFKKKEEMFMLFKFTCTVYKS
jgi:hypothetical protein